MRTTVTAVTAAIPLTLLTGQIYIHKITYQSATPGIVKFYDSVGNAVTWSAPAYSHNVFASGVASTVTQQDCCGSPEVDIETTGATVTATAVAANATEALPEVASLADGCGCVVGGLVIKHGLTALATVTGTVIVEWSPNLP